MCVCLHIVYLHIDDTYIHISTYKYITTHVHAYIYFQIYGNSGFHTLQFRRMGKVSNLDMFLKKKKNLNTRAFDLKHKIKITRVNFKCCLYFKNNTYIHFFF